MFTGFSASVIITVFCFDDVDNDDDDDDDNETEHYYDDDGNGDDSDDDDDGDTDLPLFCLAVRVPRFATPYRKTQTDQVACVLADVAVVVADGALAVVAVVDKLGKKDGGADAEEDDGKDDQHFVGIFRTGGI